MNRIRNVLITGATGFIGSYLSKTLLLDGYNIFVLAKNKENSEYKNRVKNALRFWDSNCLRNNDNLFIFKGDITKKNLGLSKEEYTFLLNEVQEIYHCAAIINYNWNIDRLREVNVYGTKRILDFAMESSQIGSLKKVNYISTAYVCGNYRGDFKERNLNVGQQFNTLYEQSKFEAEELINVYRRKGLCVDVFRPSIVAGESATGKIPVIQQHLYQVLRIWSLGVFDYFPVKNYYANIVPVDELCKGMITISINSSKENRCYHMFHSHRISMEAFLGRYKRYFGAARPVAVSVDRISELSFTPVQKKLLNELFFTFNGSVKLDSTMTEGLLKEYGFSFSKINDLYISTVLSYLEKTNYLKKQPIQ